MKDIKEYRAEIRRLFVERNSAVILAALIANPQRTSDRRGWEREAVETTGKLWDEVVRCYGHGREPSFEGSK